MTTRPDNVLQLHSQAANWGSFNYHRQTSLDETTPALASFYEISYDVSHNNNLTPSAAGIELRYDSTNDETIWDVNSTKNTGQTNNSRPLYITLVAGPSAPDGSAGTSGTLSVDSSNDVGKDIVFWGYNSNVMQMMARYTLTAGSFFISSGGGGSGSQTYTRTTHTGTILSSLQRRINRPDHDVTLGVSGLAPNEDFYFRKIGNKKFRLRWHDQNESPTYVASCYVEISSGVYDLYTLGVTQGTGDVQWDLDTSNGSGQTSFNPNNLPVMHNGRIYITFSAAVYFQGNLIAAGDAVKDWTYLGIGPFTGIILNAARARPGQDVTFSYKDENPFPDGPGVGSWKLPDGSTADMLTNDSFYGLNPWNLTQPCQKGWHYIYNVAETAQSPEHIIYKRKFGPLKVSSNFW